MPTETRGPHRIRAVKIKPTKEILREVKAQLDARDREIAGLQFDLQLQRAKLWRRHDPPVTYLDPVDGKPISAAQVEKRLAAAERTAKGTRPREK